MQTTSHDNDAVPNSADIAQENEEFDYYMPLWGGRFKAVPTGKLELFGASLTFDKRLWREDIRGSKAHARMLAAQGVITPGEADNIVAGLDAIADQIRSGNFALDPEVDEDIHMAIERVLTQNIGEDGGRLHTGRSRNDQSVLDTRLGARFFAHKLQSEIVRLQEALLGRAQQHFGVVMPGYTHLQPAQPVLFSHHLLAYFWMFSRDFARLEAAASAANVSSSKLHRTAKKPFPVTAVSAPTNEQSSSVTRWPVIRTLFPFPSSFRPVTAASDAEMAIVTPSAFRMPQVTTCPS